MFSPNFVLSPFPEAQSVSPLQEDTQTQNFLLLASKPELIPLSSLDPIYNKNAALLKKNIKLSPKCPDIEEIKTIFNEVYVLSQYSFPLFINTNHFPRKSKSSTTGSPQYFFSKGKTLFLWILSVYEHFAHISPEDLVNFIKKKTNF